MDRNDRNVLILGIAIIVALVLGYYFLLLGPLRAEYTDRKEERTAKEAQLAQLEQEVAQLEEVRRNAPEIEEELLELSKRIPSQPEIPTLLVQIEEIAVSANVTQLSVQPGAVEPPPGGGDYLRIPITISLEGTYEELQDFVLRLRNLSRLVTINEVNYEVVEEEGADVGGIERLLQVEVLAEVYIQTQAPAQTAPAPQAPPAEVTTAPGTTPDRPAGGEGTNGDS
jgi:type IV pilus assembly protein PilO